MALKMRKGTRSCRECRRRKTRCIFPLGEEVCKECNHHGRRCVDQSQAPLSGEADIIDNRPNLRVRVARLELLVERLVQSNPKGAAKALNGLDLATLSRRDSASSQTEPTYDVLFKDRAMGLHADLESHMSPRLKQDMLRQSVEISPQYRPSCYNQDYGHAKARHELISTISSEPDVFKVLEVAGSWWLPWRNLWLALTDGDHTSSLVDFVHFSLAEEDLINVSSGLICIAISLHHVRPGIDDHDMSFSIPLNLLATKIVTAVDQLALAEDDNLTCFDGLKALVLRAESYAVSNNQNRKFWLLIRRAISIAQLIDLPRHDIGDYTVQTVQLRNLMGALFEMDRFMSLLMGLPHAVNDKFGEKVTRVNLRISADGKSHMRALRRVVALAAGKVNDRNTSSSEVKEFEINLIQQILDDAASTLPCEWWNVKTHTDKLDDLRSSQEHLLTQLWFYQVQSFLHLPLMLRPASDARFERSRLVCLNSSRHLLRVYLALRQPSLASYSSKRIDFQALIAAVLVSLGILQQQLQDWHQASAATREDVDLINATRRTFERSSNEQGGSIALQGIQVIDTLGKFAADGDEINFIRAATSSVPYFGTILSESGCESSNETAASERTNSVAYTDNASSPRTSQPHLEQRHSRVASLASLVASPIAYSAAQQMLFRSPDGQLVLPLPSLDSIHQSPVGHSYSDISAPLAPSFGGAPLLPLPGSSINPPSFEPFRPNSLGSTAVNSNAGYADVDIDWQKLLVDAELELDQDWNLELNPPLNTGRPSGNK